MVRLVISTGCPAGVGPEISVRAAAALPRGPALLVGDLGTLREAAELVGIDPGRVAPLSAGSTKRGRLPVLEVDPPLGTRDRRPGHPSRAAGRAQLAYLEAAYRFAREHPGVAMVTGPVSKAAIASSGARGARRFVGHTEWLRDLDGKASTVMCFASERLTTSLVTNHLPLARVARALTPENVAEASYWLAQLLLSLRRAPVRIAVASLNPHAGEGEMFGSEEVRAIEPGMRLAQRRVGRGARFFGPIGAETAYRKAAAGEYDGVVAMYHDQATIPMKLLAFGDAVNVTMGLSLVRTSVDHGTAYDIAWRGTADASGMSAALGLALKLRAPTRQRSPGQSARLRSRTLTPPGRSPTT